MCPEPLFAVNTLSDPKTHPFLRQAAQSRGLLPSFASLDLRMADSSMTGRPSTIRFVESASVAAAGGSEGSSGGWSAYTRDNCVDQVDAFHHAAQVSSLTSTSTRASHGEALISAGAALVPTRVLLCCRVQEKPLFYRAWRVRKPPIIDSVLRQPLMDSIMRVSPPAPPLAPFPRLHGRRRGATRRRRA